MVGVRSGIQHRMVSEVGSNTNGGCQKWDPTQNGVRSGIQQKWSQIRVVTQNGFRSGIYK